MIETEVDVREGASASGSECVENIVARVMWCGAWWSCHESMYLGDGVVMETVHVREESETVSEGESATVEVALGCERVLPIGADCRTVFARHAEVPSRSQPVALLVKSCWRPPRDWPRDGVEVVWAVPE